MDVDIIIESFSKLGIFLRQFGPGGDKLMEGTDHELDSLNEEFYDRFESLVKDQYKFNGWFIEEFVRLAIGAIAENLTMTGLTAWVGRYPRLKERHKPLNIGVVMAGNIPLVGFNDFLCVMISGNNFIGKLSSKDAYLLPEIAKILSKINKEFSSLIRFTEGQMDNFDVVIATGSNNSSRYFEYYFKKYPHIIRKGRTSAALLTGNENPEQLSRLADDIFMYFGLGCRNVSKLYVPENWDFHPFFEAVEKYRYLYRFNKYANNYDYNRSVFLLNKTEHLDNGFILLRKSGELFTPVSVVNFEYYNDLNDLEQKINFFNEEIQCIIAKDIIFAGSIDFGSSQFPGLSDYADNLDTIEFLISKKNDL